MWLGVWAVRSEKERFSNEAVVFVGASQTVHIQRPESLEKDMLAAATEADGREAINPGESATSTTRYVL